MTTKAPSPIIIARVATCLEREDIVTVMIGGMAMVVYGSTRMTHDCDFAVTKDERTLRRSVEAMMDEGYGVISGWDSENYVPTKVEMARDVSAAWAVIHRPELIWFWHSTECVRIDLVFDLPVSMDEILSRAQQRTIEGTRIFIAAPIDLQRMKEVSLANRPSRITDEQDLVYLRHLNGVILAV